MTARIQSRIARCGVLAVLAIGAFLCDFNDFANLASVPSAEAQYGTSRRVARRTSRRTSRRHAAAYGAYDSGGYATAPPSSGCMVTGAFWECGGVRYQQAMQGDQIVLVPVE